MIGWTAIALGEIFFLVFVAVFGVFSGATLTERNHPEYWGFLGITAAVLVGVFVALVRLIDRHPQFVVGFVGVINFSFPFVLFSIMIWDTGIFSDLIAEGPDFGDWVLLMALAFALVMWLFFVPHGEFLDDMKMSISKRAKPRLDEPRTEKCGGNARNRVVTAISLLSFQSLSYALVVCLVAHAIALEGLVGPKLKYRELFGALVSLQSISVRGGVLLDAMKLLAVLSVCAPWLPLLRHKLRADTIKEAFKASFVCGAFAAALSACFYIVTKATVPPSDLTFGEIIMDGFLELMILVFAFWAQGWLIAHYAMTDKWGYAVRNSMLPYGLYLYALTTTPL